MLKNIFALLRIYIFWYLCFVCARLIFISFNLNAGPYCSTTELLQTFLHGLPHDLSVAAYLSVLPLLLLLLSSFLTDWQIHFNWLKVYVWLVGVVILLITLADAVLYEFWGQKLNAYAASFAKFPKDMVVFSSGASLLGPLFNVGAGVVFLYIMTNKWLKPFAPAAVAAGKAANTLLAVIAGALLFLLIRGGTGKSTLNQSAAFFSAKPFLNHAALNTTWNFIATVVEPLEDNNRNPYVYMKDELADSLVNPYLVNTSTHRMQLADTAMPNILIVMLEGWSSDVVALCGGTAPCTPQLNALAKDGLFMSRFYANGNRTDKGLAAILSAQPALPHSSIINRIEKFSALPALPQTFANKGYYTSFFYGGDIDFANMKAYLLNAGMQHISDVSDFALTERNAEWGVHDDKLWEHTLAALNKQPAPFFSVVLTLSSHEPFNIPAPQKFGAAAGADEYKSAVYYADSCLGIFMQAMKQMPWYKNTLVILVADHGHKYPLMRPAFDPQLYHIPMLITGGALHKAYRGQQFKRIANQTDIAATLLGELGWQHSAFRWSRNFTDTVTPAFASYVYNDGIGWVNDSAVWVFDDEVKDLIIYESKLPKARLQEQINLSKAWKQVYYNEYLKR